MRKLLTLVVPTKGSKVLLGMKKRGFGAGRWNGFGGKVEQGETIEQAALRELREEVGIETGMLQEKGLIEFMFENEDKVLEVHVFTLDGFSEQPVETEEMRPQWFSVDTMPYSQMWGGDDQWFPLLLAGKKFKGEFLFDKPATAEYAGKILSQKLIES